MMETFLLMTAGKSTLKTIVLSEGYVTTKYSMSSLKSDYYFCHIIIPKYLYMCKTNVD